MDLLRGSVLELSVEVSNKFVNVDKPSTQVQRPGVVDRTRDDSLQKIKCVKYTSVEKFQWSKLCLWLYASVTWVIRFSAAPSQD